MDIVKQARELGKLIQKEDAYIKMQNAKEKSDNDKELQDLIGDFNLKRMAINNEAGKQNRDDEKMQNLNKEMRSAYSKIMENENMISYNNAKTNLDIVMQRVIAIITQSSQGEDPETTDYSPSCTGSCGSCSGC